LTGEIIWKADSGHKSAQLRFVIIPTVSSLLMMATFFNMILIFTMASAALLVMPVYAAFLDYLHVGPTSLLLLRLALHLVL